jgi:tetratricopeptide (TPR) repeat protein
VAESAMPRSERPDRPRSEDAFAEFGGHAPADRPGTASPVDRAVWRLRSRGCWEDAAALLESYAATDPAAAIRRAALLVERCMFTADGWASAEEALRAAEALPVSDEQRGAAACERGQLAYAATVLGVRDRADEARAALGRAAALLPPDARARATLDYRRGLLAEHLSETPQSARAAYRRAHTAATSHGDALLCSFTWRHLAGLALRAGEPAEARHGFRESLRLREELGFLVGMAPALTALADVELEPEATRLREEAGRLFRLLGGIPTWLAPQLPTAA